MIFAQAQPAQAGSAISALLPLILIFFVFYFLLILPQQRKQKVHKKMLDELKEGDKIVTVGGAMGVVNKIKDNVVTIEFKDGVKIDYLRNAISQVMKPQM
jgi:preprotein translocase subunit YajC